MNALPPGAGRVGRRLARGVARPHRRARAVAVHVAGERHRRALLAARLGAPRLRPHRSARRCSSPAGRTATATTPSARWRRWRATMCRVGCSPGPWAHASTSSSLPGPRIDLVPEMVRWWDRWLRGVENGVDAEPEAVWYVRGSHRPAPDLDTVPGYWRAEEWPSPRSGTRTPDHPRPQAVRRPARRRHRRLDLLRRPPALRPAAGPAARRRRLAHVGLRRRGGGARGPRRCCTSRWPATDPRPRSP